MKSRGCFICYSGEQLKRSALEIPRACQTNIDPDVSFENAGEKTSVYVHAKTDVRTRRATLTEATLIHGKDEETIGKRFTGGFLERRTREEFRHHHSLVHL